MHHLTRALVSTTRQERGATAVEYGLMIALIAMAIFGGIYLLGPNLDALFDEVAASL
jgi:pilus assembly protein Flp/PilA